MRVLIALPVYNEEAYVEDILARVRIVPADVLVVDDGSTDATQEILRKLTGIRIIRHATNQGYGRSLIDAFKFASRRGYEWIITIDCDLQHEPAQIPSFLDRTACGDVDIVSGSRYFTSLDESNHAPPDRRRINAEITRLLNRKLGLQLTDAFCGFKAYRTEAIERLALSEDGYAFPLQFWVQAAIHGLRICELSVPLIYPDPTRHFGGILDDPGARLQHYLDVFHAEVRKTTGEAPMRPIPMLQHICQCTSFDRQPARRRCSPYCE